MGRGALLMSALALGGCSTSIADLPLVGTPADAPARPKEAGTYLPVHDLPPDREEAAMAPAERAKVEARTGRRADRQASGAAKAAKTPAAIMAVNGWRSRASVVKEPNSTANQGKDTDFAPEFALNP